MSPRELVRRRERAETETLIIAKTDAGYRVHSPTTPSRIYLVTGDPQAPTCTCPDFEYNADDPAWRCKHILAVEERFRPEQADEEDDPVAAEERAAIQEEASPRPLRRTRSPKLTNGTAQMLLKRSVSPDGRIDSLSVEFSTQVETLSVGDIKERAEKILALQCGIVEGFLDREIERGGEVATPENGNGSAVPARLLAIAGMNGKYGRRLFITVQVNGETLKLFGNRAQLAEAITGAGFGNLAGNITEGAPLNVPCRVTTKPSPDGRYTNVELVLPANGNPPQRRTL